MLRLHAVGLNIFPSDCATIARAVELCNPSVYCAYTSVMAGVGSLAYEQLARDCEQSGGAWEGLLARRRVPDADGYILVSWSAGYGYTRELLRVEGLPTKVVCVAALDSIYDDLELSHLDVWVKLAGQAVAGGVAFVVGASAINYMESAPTPLGARYASTGRVADAIATALKLTGRGGRVEDSLRAGSLILAHFPGQDNAAHAAAVRGWGPGLVAEGVHAWLLEHQVASTEPPPSTAPAPEPVSRGYAVSALARARGADASRYQGPGEGNGWAAWHASPGVHFGAARATTSLHVDDAFAANWAGMRSLDARIAYGWHDPGADPVAQARLLAEQLGADVRGAKVAIDVEPGPYDLARWRRLLGAGADMVAWVRELQRRGADVGCYAARWAWFWGSLLSDLGCWLWVADGSVASLRAGYPTLIPAGWPAWQQSAPVDWARPGAVPLIWQCGKAPLPGEPEQVDLDYFRGDEAALRLWSM